MRKICHGLSLIIRHLFICVTLFVRIITYCISKTDNNVWFSTSIEYCVSINRGGIGGHPVKMKNGPKAPPTIVSASKKCIRPHYDEFNLWAKNA